MRTTKMTPKAWTALSLLFREARGTNGHRRSSAEAYVRVATMVRQPRTKEDHHLTTQEVDAVEAQALVEHLKFRNQATPF